ncbi:uncharacterized protein ACBT57_021228 [Dama dama]
MRPPRLGAPGSAFLPPRSLRRPLSGGRLGVRFSPQEPRARRSQEHPPPPCPRPTEVRAAPGCGAGNVSGRRACPSAPPPQAYREHSAGLRSSLSCRSELGPSPTHRHLKPLPGTEILIEFFDIRISRASLGREAVVAEEANPPLPSASLWEADHRAAALPRLSCLRQLPSCG